MIYAVFYLGKCADGLTHTPRAYKKNALHQHKRHDIQFTIHKPNKRLVYAKTR